MSKLFKYGMKLHGFSPGSQPMYGLRRIMDDPTGKYHDILLYKDKLSEKTLEVYELDYLGENEEDNSRDFEVKQVTKHLGEFYSHRIANDDREAVRILDQFTKVFCIDAEVTDDLAFRCKECPFEMEDGTCLVKTFCLKFAPDYKEFGSMGDL